MRCLATTQPGAFFNALLKIIIRNYFFKRKIGLLEIQCLLRENFFKKSALGHRTKAKLRYLAQVIQTNLFQTNEKT